MAYTVGSLFSGIGGIDLAASWAGFKTAWFVERDMFCQGVLHRHWPGVPVYGDIFEVNDLPPVDVIAGGFPCQPFSVAGKRKGAADERYLLPEMIRIVNEVTPHVVLFENVPGFASSNDGAEFRWLLRTLAEMGYDAEWGYIRASDVGAPHRRERWFCVAYHTGAGWHGRMGSSRSETAIRDVFDDGLSERSENVGVANGERCTELYAAACQREVGQCTGRIAPVGLSREAQPGLGRASDGLSARLDFPGWPSRPGEPQHDYEPPRVTSGRTPQRAARLKALGNAVVPQQVYPLFEAIHEWLAQAERIMLAVN